MIDLPNDIRLRIEAPNFWYVATLNGDGSPHVSPMWVGLDGDLLLINTSVGRVKERNLRRDPRVCLSHADAADPYDRVQIRGRAVRFVEGPEADRNMDELARAYRGAAGYEWLLPGERRVMVLIEPDRARRVTGVEPLPAGAPGAVS
ncbi:PPOX class F420-dependent oxidoreductase [Streptomyces sp. NBC_01525]|uniref:PPOX class F420-dependent oxidoreductase n=1 Tax=Streptomyces benahoarensis TaxID=2595054 RepID=A0A553X7V9_9ACTN|nr:PPOX class F420-dependent oxidoreductase [Streptomyces benahoarensis]TSB13027.1 PPOX class F420-dependent oxidoreductase [Streptomyces benahoarensis]TSB13925.1 PPOX class F420-dependent oxidoreductase [Streptomyces benahoarensis]